MSRGGDILRGLDRRVYQEIMSYGLYQNKLLFERSKERYLTKNYNKNICKIVKIKIMLSTINENSMKQWKFSSETKLEIESIFSKIEL